MNEKLAVEVIDGKNMLLDFSDKHKRNSRLAGLGIVGKLKDEQAVLATEELKTRLENLLSIEALYFEDIHVFQNTVDTPRNIFEEESPEEWLQGEIAPESTSVRYGVTRLHDDAHLLWDRRSVSDYSRDGNGFPKRIIELLNGLQRSGLPVGVSLTVWTPASLAEQKGIQADPMLVLELSDQIVVGLIRWNPTL